MNNYFFSGSALTVLAFAYIFIARKLGLYDHPVGRSSHTERTITGFGIVFPFAYLAYALVANQEFNLYFFTGLMLLTVISFIDDIVFVKHSIRFLFQIIALILMCIDLPFGEQFDEKLPVIIAAVIFGIGVLNAFNFMDGINGMLGLNTIVILCSFLFLNETLVDGEGRLLHFTNSYFLILLIVVLLVFLFFNFRTKAVSFMGDAGSISLAFMIIYVMYSLLLKTGNYSYLLLFAVLGVDSSMTVFYKLIQRENIFIPHRDFLFKKLVHVAKLTHLKVSVWYAFVQILVTAIVIFQPYQRKLSSQIAVLFIILVFLVTAYIMLRNRFTKKRIWLVKKD